MIRSFEHLSHDDIVRLAREQADAFEPCSHGFAPGTSQACSLEHAYTARRRELEEVEG